MFRPITKISVIAFSALMLCLIACTHSGYSTEKITSMLDKADQAIAEGDTLTAEHLYEDLAKNQESMLPSQLCRQAIGYAHLAELSFSQAHMASAAQCFAAAMDISQDSVAEFVSSLPYSDIATFVVIRELNNALNPNTLQMPAQVDYEEYYEIEDSI